MWFALNKSILYRIVRKRVDLFHALWRNVSGSYLSTDRGSESGLWMLLEPLVFPGSGTQVISLHPAIVRIDSIPEAGQGPGKGLLLEKQLKAYFL